MSEPIPNLVPTYQTLHELLLEHLREKPNFLGVMQQISAEADSLDAANHELWNLYDIDAMVGAQLDMLGRVANEPRGGRADVEYRVVLKVLFSTQMSGTPDEILKVVAEVTGSTSVQYIPEYPAAFWVLPDGVAPMSNTFLRSLAPAGVQAFQACFLALTTGELLETVSSAESILVVGPCVGSSVYPYDRTWDGGLGSVDPDAAVFVDAWPFRDGLGIGEQPDAGLGPIDPDLYTFTDNTYAEDTGG